MFDLIIKNALIIDGSGSPMSPGDVGIKSGKITAVQKNISLDRSEKVFNADRKILCPGFIDAHGHSDISIIASPEAIGKISQGITTEIIGNCGLSAFPITNLNRGHLQDLYKSYNVEITWNSLLEYQNLIDQIQPAINIASLCGHNSICGSICGYDDGLKDARSLTKMQFLLRESLQNGALGLSTGLIYVPGKFSPPEEIQLLLEELSLSGKPYTTHLRNEGELLLEAVDEAIQCVCKSACRRLHISHLKTSGRKNWSKINALLSSISENREKGLDITADRYPYCESMTQLSSFIPAPYDNLDDIELQQSLNNPVFLKDFLNSFENYSSVYLRALKLVSTNCKKYAEFCGMAFSEISDLSQLPIPTIITEILTEDAAGSSASSSGMNENNMMRILKEDYVCCGSDESARPADFSIGRCHPRGFGSFPRFIKLLNKELGLEKTIKKVTLLPAEIFGLKDRGKIKQNYAADLVLLDIDSLTDNADFRIPHAISKGILKVWVNGTLAWDEGKLVSRCGKYLAR